VHLFNVSKLTRIYSSRADLFPNDRSHPRPLPDRREARRRRHGRGLQGPRFPPGPPGSPV